MAFAGAAIDTPGASAVMNDLTSMGFTTTANLSSYSSKAANTMLGRHSAKPTHKFGKASSNDQITSGETTENLACKTTVVSASGGIQVFYLKAIIDSV